MKPFNHTTGEYLETGGAKIYFDQTGNKNNPALLLLHGGFGNMEEMNLIASWFSDKYHVIAIDSRGHGSSTSGNSALTYAQIQHDAESILEYLDITTTSIIGFSDGGIAAYRMAATKIINVEKLVTIGASWQNSDIEELEEMYCSLTTEIVKEMFADNYKSYTQLNPEPDFDRFTRSVLSMWLDKTEKGHPNELVEQINAPTLLIRGDEDFLVSSDSLIALKSRISHLSFFNIPFAGHVVYKEQPEVVKIILEQFME